jgi:hypothetical protein
VYYCSLQLNHKLAFYVMNASGTLSSPVLHACAVLRRNPVYHLPYALQYEGLKHRFETTIDNIHFKDIY